MSTMREVAELQEAYQRLIEDSQALRIARKEMDLDEMVDLLEALKDDTP